MLTTIKEINEERLYIVITQFHCVNDILKDSLAFSGSVIPPKTKLTALTQVSTDI